MNTYYGGHKKWYQILVDINKIPTPSTFHVKFLHTHVPQLLPFQEAADYTAKIIGQNYKNLYVAMSGGLDSEYIAETLYRNNVDFKPVIVIRDDTNYHEFALVWCKKHNLIPKILTVNEKDIYSNNMKIMAQEKICFDNYNLFQIIANLIDGHLLVGEPSIGNDSNPIYGNPIGTIFGIAVGSFVLDICNPGKHPGAFFMYTPEILLSTASHIDTTLSDPESRSDLYQIPFRPKCEPTIMQQKTYDSIFYLNKLNNYSKLNDHKYFTKDELINLLTHPSGL